MSQDDLPCVQQRFIVQLKIKLMTRVVRLRTRLSADNKTDSLLIGCEHDIKRSKYHVSSSQKYFDIGLFIVYEIKMEQTDKTHKINSQNIFNHCTWSFDTTENNPFHIRHRILYLSSSTH